MVTDVVLPPKRRMYQPRIDPHARKVHFTLPAARAQSGLANVERAIEVGIGEMVEHFLRAGVGKSVGVRTTAASGLVHDAGGVVVGEVVRQGFLGVPQTPAAAGGGCGRVVGDEESGEGRGRRVLCAVAQPEHVPTVTVRGQRLEGSGRIEDMSASEGELGELRLQ